MNEVPQANHYNEVHLQGEKNAQNSDFQTGYNQALAKVIPLKKNGHRAPDNMGEHLHPPKMQGGHHFNRDSLQTSSSSGLKSFKDVADLQPLQMETS